MWEYYTNFILHAINILLFAWRFNQYSTPLKIIGINVIVTCIIEIYASNLSLRNINNLFLYHGMAIIHFSALSLFYHLLIENKILKLFILAALPLFYACAVVNVLYFNKLEDYPSYLLIVKHSLTSIYVLAYFLQLFYNPKQQQVQLEPFFWISAGLLLSSLGNFFIEGLMNHLIERSNSIALRFYLSGVVLTFVYYLSISIALLVFNMSRKYPYLNT